MIALMLMVALLAAQDPAPHAYVPPDGFVPEAAPASRLAEAVWIPIYGKDHILKERPFHATLTGDVWTVTGSLPGGPGQIGGVALAEISKQDARIIRVSHGK
jgi:hypothetical protein